MRARDQSSIFSTGGKFRPDYGLLLELHALTLDARSYAFLATEMPTLTHFAWDSRIWYLSHALTHRSRNLTPTGKVILNTRPRP